MILGKIMHKLVKLGKWIQTEQEIICIFGVNLRILLLKTYFEGMIYIPTTNVQYKDLLTK